MHVVATVEARMASTRVPGKSLLDIAGKPLLERVVDRIRLSRRIQDVVIATSINPLDDAIEALAHRIGVACHRGSEEDVLDRVVQAAESVRAEVTVQFGGDSPFVDPQLVDRLIERYLREPGVDLVTNCLQLTYPLGIYAYVVPMRAMRDIATLASTKPEREDVTRYLWEHPERYTLVNLTAPPELHRPEIRLTVDYPEDVTLTRELYRILPEGFTTQDVLDALDARPELAALNRHCVQRSAPHLSVPADA